MSHETAQQRAARHRADRYRKQIKAVKVEDMPAVLCRCGHQELIHTPKCARRECGCTEYRERGECGDC